MVSRKKIGIFANKKEFKNSIEERLPLQKEFENELDQAVKASKVKKGKPLKSIL